MKYPRFLKRKDSISLIAPSLGSPMDPYFTRLNAGIAYFESLGYNIIKGKYIFKNDKVESTNSVNRANELMEEYLNPNSSFVWAITGGEIMFDILDKIDFEKLKNAPYKFYGGYSDNTNFSFVFTTMCDVATLYCNHIGDFSSKHKQNDDLLALLEGRKLTFNNYLKYERNSLKYENPLACLNEEFDVKYKSIGNTSFEGRIIGGCFDLLEMIAGTKYDKFNEFAKRYEKDGIILYLDSCDLNSISFYRSLLKLKYCGWFDNNIKGILIGRVANIDEPFGFSFKEAIEKVIVPLNIPVIYDVDIGHVAPTFPIINGSYAIVNLKDNKFEIEYKLI